MFKVEEEAKEGKQGHLYVESETRKFYVAVAIKGITGSLLLSSLVNMSYI